MRKKGSRATPSKSSLEERGAREVWSRIPSSNCKGLCQDQCTVITGSSVEMRILRRHMPNFPSVSEQLEAASVSQYQCPLLDEEGRCTAYEDRPTICRLWGTTEDLVCPHGCEPDGGHITHDAGMALLTESMQFGEPEVQ